MFRDCFQPGENAGKYQVFSALVTLVEYLPEAQYCNA